MSTAKWRTCPGFGTVIAPTLAGSACRAHCPDRVMRALRGGAAGLSAGAFQSLSLGPFDVGGPAGRFEELDDPGRRVDLAAVDPMPRACRVCMVQVVPALPH